MSLQPLFTPLRMGDLDLPNRIVMAPLTRMRAGSMDHVSTALQAEYYAQRGSAGPQFQDALKIQHRCARREEPVGSGPSTKLYRSEGRQKSGRPNGKLRSLEMMPVDSEFSDL
jgi:hypothetical protein